METLLLGIHIQLAAVSKCPEIEFTPTEAANLANAISSVQEQYPATRIDPKIACLLQLGGTVAFIYGTKLSAIRIRILRERRNPQTETAYSPPPPPQPTANNPAPAAPSNFAPIQQWEPFGTEAPTPRGVIDFPIIRAV